MSACEHSSTLDNFDYVRICEIQKVKDSRGERQEVCIGNWKNPVAVRSCEVKKEHDKKKQEEEQEKKINLEDCIIE